MPNSNPQIERETKTIQHMVRIYCRGQHHTGGKICDACGPLLQYALECISRCPYQMGAKPACGMCPTHCFSPAMQKKFNEIMRYAGPRMLLVHPFLTAQHVWDALRYTRRIRTQQK